MGTNECSQPASKSSWDSQDFVDINMVLKMARFRKSNGPRWVKLVSTSSDRLIYIMEIYIGKTTSLYWDGPQ